MADFQRVDPQGWNCDLHSVYSAYLGHFQVHHIAWYERSWAHLFESFSEFLAISWPVIVVTDATTGKAHITTRSRAIAEFVKMVRTRFGDTLPHVDNILHVTPFETTPRRVHNIEDWTSYKKLHATLPAAVLASFKARVRAGDPKLINDLWSAKDKTFMAIDFEWSERNPNSALEWGYAAARCGHLADVGAWPPDPETNYRKGHYVVTDYLDKYHNKHVPNCPRHYAFGESALVGKARLPVIIQAVISSLATPDSETVANGLVLVGHGLRGDLERMEELKIKIPHNMLVIDIAAYERQLFVAGQRGAMTDVKTGKPRANTSTLSLDNVLRSLGIDVQVVLHNSGNDAFLAMLAFQMLLAPESTIVPSTVGRGGMRRISTMPMLPMASPGFTGPLTPPMMQGAFLSPTPPLGSPGSGRPLSDGYFNQQRRPSGGHQSLQRPTSGFSTAGRSSHRLSSYTPDEMGALSNGEQRTASTERSIRTEARRQPGRPSSTGIVMEGSTSRSSGESRLTRVMKNLTLS